jgi:hypothetical protein
VTLVISTWEVRNGDIHDPPMNVPIAGCYSTYGATALGATALACDVRLGFPDIRHGVLRLAGYEPQFTGHLTKPSQLRNNVVSVFAEPRNLAAEMRRRKLTCSPSPK